MKYLLKQIEERNMKLYRIAVFSAAGGDIMQGKKSAAAAIGRRLNRRSAILLLGLVMPLLFVRTAFLVMESAALCSSDIGCITWRVFGGSDAPLLREEVMKAFMEAGSSNVVDDDEGSNIGPISFKDLLNDMISNRQDIKAFAINTKTMVDKMQRMVQRGKMQESIYWHLASQSVPKSLHCLSLTLAEEYAVNAVARSRLPPPQHVHRLTDRFHNHFVILTDNVLAASVVVSSAVRSSVNPEKLVFHVVTDKKSYTSMHSWFAVNAVGSAVVEVKGLHQYDWSRELNFEVEQMMEIHHQMWKCKYRELMKQGFGYVNEFDHKLDVFNPSCVSLLNHLRIYLPQLFPDLDKVVVLDDDVVVQHDLSSLWAMDLDNKVVGAVVQDSWCGPGCCPGRTYQDYFNFNQPIISSNFHQNRNRCAWLHGMNVFDLKQWRNTNITSTYHQWLQLNLKSGFALWHPGAFPPALIAFGNHIHALDPTWHLAGLGHRHPNVVHKDALEAAKVVHFSGPAKPWLGIASPEVRRVWYKHVNLSNDCVRRCGIMR